MTLNEYLSEHSTSLAMISVKIGDKDPIQYNYWNIFPVGIHLLDDNYKIDYIIHDCNIVSQEDGSILLQSNYHPKNCIMNFYFGGAIP